ncbi:MAG: TIGR02281 family clan AA aspartic protease [Rhizobiaceae bacterium]
MPWKGNANTDTGWMLRNFFIVGAVVVASASVPAFLESNPEVLDKFVGNKRDSGEVTEVVAPVIQKKPEAKKLGGTRTLTGRRVAISMDAHGHFSGDFKLNGRRVNSLIDTGATLVAINKSTARRIGLNLMPNDFKYEVNTANGKAKAAAAKIARLQIGRIYVENVEAVVLNDRALDNTLIGMSFLNRLRKFRVENRVLHLEQ